MDEELGTMIGPPEKPQRVKNKWYREFLDYGRITCLTKAELDLALANVRGKYTKAGRALLIIMYYTGCRPVETFLIRTNECRLQKDVLSIYLRTAKRGVPREVHLPLNNNASKKHIRELRDYVMSMPPESYLFGWFRSSAKHIKRRKDGTVYYIPDPAHKFHYLFKKWFGNVRDGGIIPYFLRHNAFSRLAEMNWTETEIKYFKGARSVKSVEPYIHLSTAKARKISKDLAKI
jgi:integrase